VGRDRGGDAGAGVGVRFVLCTNAHLSDDEAVAKMGHRICGDLGRCGAVSKMRGFFAALRMTILQLSTLLI